MIGNWNTTRMTTAETTRPTPKSAAGATTATAVKTAPPRRGALKETEDIRRKLNLLYEISRKVGSAQQQSQIVQQITQMTRKALKASAASVLLLENDNRDLVFEVADGPAGKQLNRVKISAQSGVAGWVATHGEPLMVNDAAKDPRFNESVDKSTGFETKSIICTPLVMHARTIGVLEVLNKLDGAPFTQHDLETLTSVASTAALAIHNARLHQGTLDSYKSTVKVLAAAIDARDPYACGHSQRVAEYTVLEASSLPLSREERENIEYAAILHDIGKVYIPDKILLKSESLSPEEWKVMRKHPGIASNLLRQVPSLDKVSMLVLHHHERYDGSGYPDGLKGEAIPLGARLIAVADAFDTMTTSRLYRAACDADFAIVKLRRLSGTQFCPVSVKAFITGFSRFHMGVKV